MPFEQIPTEELKNLWCDSGRTPKFWRLDARAVFPIFIFILHWSYLTFFIAVSSIIALSLVGRTGMSPMAFTHYLSQLIVGKRRETVIHETILRKRCRW